MLARGCWSEVERFAAAEFIRAGRRPRPDWRIADDGTCRAGAQRGTLRWPRELPQLGRHNRLNALAALAAARHVGCRRRSGDRGARAVSAASSAVSKSRGTVRGVTVYDDFAHHPTAIATTIDGLRHEVGPRASSR